MVYYGQKICEAEIKHSKNISALSEADKKHCNQLSSDQLEKYLKEHPVENQDNSEENP